MNYIKYPKKTYCTKHIQYKRVEAKASMSRQRPDLFKASQGQG